MPIQPKDWSNPFQWIESKFHEEESSWHLLASHNRFAVKLYHLQLIWERLGEGTEVIERYTSQPWNKRSRKSGLIKHLEMSKFLRLDLDDFYIHGRILMDRTTDLIAYLIDGPARSHRKMSFQRHREFFLKKVPYEEDETYAEQVRKNTNWFDAVLRTTRDIFVVHDTTTRSSGILFGPRGAPQTFRQGISSGKELERMREKLYDLRSRYAGLIPKISDETNLYELLGLFDRHADILNKEDLTLLSQIKATIGAKIPDVNILADDILAFLRFVGEHFSKKFAQTSFFKAWEG